VAKAKEVRLKIEAQAKMEVARVAGSQRERGWKAKRNLAPQDQVGCNSCEDQGCGDVGGWPWPASVFSCFPRQCSFGWICFSPSCFSFATAHPTPSSPEKGGCCPASKGLLTTLMPMRKNKKKRRQMLVMVSSAKPAMMQGVLMTKVLTTKVLTSTTTMRRRWLLDPCLHFLVTSSTT